MITPLSKIKTALLLVDWNGSDSEETADLAREFFRSHGIELSVVDPKPGDFNIFGLIRKSTILPGGRKAKRHEDLFISLAMEGSRAERHVYRNSPAIFKLGRSNMRKMPYDITISNPEGKTYSQKDVFATMAENICKIK